MKNSYDIAARCRTNTSAPSCSTTTDNTTTRACQGILLTGGKLRGNVSTVTSELYIPSSCSGAPRHCQLADVAEVERLGHSQDGFMVCGGVGHEYDCRTYNPLSGSWEETWSWADSPVGAPPRSYHVSWAGPGGVFLGGGRGEELSSTWLDQGSGNIYFFEKPNTRIINPIFGTQVIKYYTNGSSPEVLPSLLIPRLNHSCGRYTHDGKEMLIVVAGITACNDSWCSTYNMTTTPTMTVEVYDLTSPAPTWLNTTAYPHLRSGTRGVTLNNTFYVTGLDIIEWNPETEQWTEVAQLCHGRNAHGASVVPVTEDLLQHCRSQICNETEVEATTTAESLAGLTEAVLESG